MEKKCEECGVYDVGDIKLTLDLGRKHPSLRPLGFNSWRNAEKLDGKDSEITVRCGCKVHVRDRLMHKIKTEMAGATM
jgi:hypothetical protein